MRVYPKGEGAPISQAVWAICKCRVFFWFYYSLHSFSVSCFFVILFFVLIAPFLTSSAPFRHCYSFSSHPSPSHLPRRLRPCSSSLVAAWRTINPMNADPCPRMHLAFIMARVTAIERCDNLRKTRKKTSTRMAGTITVDAVFICS